MRLRREGALFFRNASDVLCMKLPFAKYSSIAFASVIFAFASFGTENNQNEDKTMKYTLTPLEYPENALEPWIDAETVALHHGKHQAAYVEKLNAALASEPSFKFDGSVCELISNLDAVPVSIRAAVRNNGGGVANHEFYWRGLSPQKTHPSDELLCAIKDSFGSFENFRKTMTAAAMGQFGSGWAWLGVLPDGKLKICATPNQDSPVMGKDVAPCGMKPILCFDVWEHAYYIKYRNRRADYVEALWNLINWKRVSERFDKISKCGKVVKS